MDTWNKPPVCQYGLLRTLTLQESFRSLKPLEQKNVIHRLRWSQDPAPGIYFRCPRRLHPRIGGSLNEQDSRDLADRIGSIRNVLRNSEEHCIEQFGESERRGCDDRGWQRPYAFVSPQAMLTEQIV